MAITATEIRTVLNARLNRAETNIDEQIRSAIYDLSERALWRDLYSSDEEGATTDGGTTVALPDRFRVLDSVQLNDGTYDYPPLELATMQQIIEWRERETAAGESRPESYCIRGGNIEVYPTADAEYVVKWRYWQRHIDPTGGTILFDEAFREAIYNCAMMKYLEGLSLVSDPKYAEKAALYVAEVAKLMPTWADHKTHALQYTDI